MADEAFLGGVCYPDVDHGEVTILLKMEVIQAHIELEVR